MTQGGIALLAVTAADAEDPQTLRMVAGAIANLCGNGKLIHFSVGLPLSPSPLLSLSDHGRNSSIFFTTIFSVFMKPMRPYRFK